MLDPDTLLSSLITWIPLVLSLSVHEWAHAWAAWRLGDDTASLQGRMTLNPLAHIDPIGTVLLPLLGVPFGWARPVPVNPLRFRSGVNMRRGMMLTALAGPVSNLALAVLGTLGLALLVRFAPLFGERAITFVPLLQLVIGLNVVLATFNLFPIPPLDGSRIADYLMPAPLRPLWESFAQLGPFALLGLILLPRMLHVDLLAWPMQAMNSLLEVFLKLLGV
jgi:Zn-dependent protease